MLCAGAADKGACVGDTGGPVILQNGNDHMVMGVVSWGGSCTNLPLVYARISSVVPWISSVACDEWKTTIYGLCDKESPTFVPSETGWPSSTMSPTETEIPYETQVPEDEETDDD